MTLEEEALLSGDCGIINETGGKVDLQVGLNDNTIRYTGSTNAGLTVTGIASLGKISEFNNNSNGGVRFSGRMYDGAKVNFEGKGTGDFRLLTGTNVEGNCILLNESSERFVLKNVNIPDGTVLKNIGSKGVFYLETAGGGVVNIEPGTEFAVVNISNNVSGLDNWGTLKLSSGTIYIESGRIILNGSFGGTLTVNASGAYLYHLVNNLNWNGQKITTRINNVGSGTQPGRYIYLCTSNLENYTSVESTVNVYLYGAFLNGVDIKVKGESNRGTVLFYGPGTYSGKIEINYTAGIGGSISFYNNLNGLENFTYNSAVAGILVVRNGAVLGKNIMINNESSKSVYVNSGVSIGDDVTIDISADNKSDIYISQDVPAGTYLSY